jgi:hypothetical protein
MVSRCFNPACSALFHSLEEGTVFRLDFAPTFPKCGVVVARARANHLQRLGQQDRVKE